MGAGHQPGQRSLGNILLHERTSGKVEEENERENCQVKNSGAQKL